MATPRHLAHGSFHLPMLGRDSQRELVRSAMANGADRGVLVLLPASAGAGKSRFLDEAFDRSAAGVLRARAVLPERAQPWSLMRAILRDLLALDGGPAQRLGSYSLGALAVVVPELADLAEVGDAPLDPRSRQALVLEGGLALLRAAASTARVLVLDDLQWADSDSLAWAAVALERDPALAAVLGFRPDEVPADGEVRAFVDALASRRRTITVSLDPLSAADLRAVLEPAAADAVTAATDGSPFAVVELVAALVEGGRLTQDGRLRWRSSAEGIAEAAKELGRAGRLRAVQARVSRHQHAVQQVLALLSLVARDVSAAALAKASGAEERQVLDALTRLAGSGLARLGDRGWATGHDLVGEAVRDGLEPAERGRLHGLLAHALEQEGADPAELASHHAAAGHADDAARCYAVAAERLLEGAALPEAYRLADSAVTLATRPELARAALVARGRVRARSGDLSGAREDLRQALARGAVGPERSTLLADLAMQYAGAEDPHRAGELAELAVVEAGLDAGARGRALEVAAILDMNLGRPDRARERSEEARLLYARTGDSQGAARVLDSRAMATFLDGEITQAMRLFRGVADLFADSGDLFRSITPRSTLGHALVFHDDPVVGLAETDAAVETARTLGSIEGQSYALWHRSEALSAVGRCAEALAAAGEALDLARRAGHRGWTATAERAVGIALSAAGDLPAARDAFHRSLILSDHLEIFASWASSRLAMTLVELGTPDGARPYVERALAEGPGLAQFEARQAQAEVAAALADPQAPALARDALEIAERYGHLASARRLTKLLDG